MKSVNYPLRKMYRTALNSIVYNGTPVKNFYQKAPDDIEDDNYIVFGTISNADVSNQYKSDTDSSIQVTIHTFRSKYNDGAAADDIAGLVLAAIYPDKQTHIDMSVDGLQNVSTILSGDVTQGYNIQGAREYIDRVLTFSHRIFHQ